MLSTENTWVLKSSLLKYIVTECLLYAHMGQVYLSGQHSEMTPPPYHKNKSFIECKHLCRNKDGREADRYLMASSIKKLRYVSEDGGEIAWKI